MRAIADANMQSAVDKVTQQREVADKMEKLERQAAINDQINESVKQEEQRVIDAANRRMAEVHAKKAEEANAAFKAIESAAVERKATETAARKKELDAVTKIRATHAINVVAWAPNAKLINSLTWWNNIWYWVDGKKLHSMGPIWGSELICSVLECIAMITLEYLFYIPQGEMLIAINE